MKTINPKLVLISLLGLPIIAGLIFWWSVIGQNSEVNVRPEFYEGLTAFEAGDVTRAETMWNKALDRSPTFDSGTAIWLGMLMKEQGRLDEAAPILEKVLAANRITFGAESFETACVMRQLADIYEQEGKLDKANVLQKGALQIFLKVKGPEALETALSVDGLARILLKREQPIEARSFLVESLRMFEEKLGKSHRNTQFIRRSLVTTSISQ